MLFRAELFGGNGPTFPVNEHFKELGEDSRGQMYKEVVSEERHLLQRPCEKGREVEVGLSILANPVEIVLRSSN